jgi:hypothetical protein
MILKDYEAGDYVHIKFDKDSKFANNQWDRILWARQGL